MTYEKLKEINIAEIIAILPEEKDFLSLNADIQDIPYTVLAYNHTHEPILQKEQYMQIAKKIDEYAKRPRSEARNILVFCNNGFQRSLPFLVYYMTTLHPDEFPTIDKAMGFLLTIIANKTTFEEKVQMIKNVKELFTNQVV